MEGSKYKPIGEDEGLLEFAARIRRERDERIAKIREKRLAEMDPSPGLKELVATQDEWAERVRQKLRAAFRG
jgi:hypothetical protein